jgi:hypothetical protein
MEDAKRFGAELADATVMVMKTEGIGSQEAAVFAAQEIVHQADAMTSAGETSEKVSTWTQLVVKAYGERLDQRIRETEALLTKPQ